MRTSNRIIWGMNTEATFSLSALPASAVERIPLQITSSSATVARVVAGEIAAGIKKKQSEGTTYVLGLATGSTPTAVYAELIRLHKQEGLSFRNVVTFNLDEYYPMKPHEQQSYVRFMHEQLFDHIDIPPEQINIPDGTLKPEEIPAFCAQYEKKIADLGGIDFQILGIGRSGHIGFNEPGSTRDSRTRLIVLDRITRLDAASDFFGEENVPRRAMTMGVATVLSAKRIVMLAFGENKAAVITKAIEGPATSSCPASFLQQHSNVTVYLDEAAAAQLTRTRCPWTVTPITQWNELAVRHAVIWLAQERGKTILELINEDYNEAGLQDLLASRGNAHEINVDVFRELTASITGWPGGKPKSAKRPGDIDRPADRIYPKKVVVFSPHPDDDVISMGGTLARLCDHGHDVHVAYQTSGNIAVFDHDAQRYAQFAIDFAGTLKKKSNGDVVALANNVLDEIRAKKPGDMDGPSTRTIKTLIRQGEAIAGAAVCGVKEKNVHFMNLPFYETGTIRKNPVGPEDVTIVAKLLDEVQPHQIYAAGDLSDPHGTHRVCLNAIMLALQQLKDKPWMKDCEVWLYRGAWQEWEPERIEMAVPLSPDEVRRKREAIFRHQSQKDRAMYPGADPREFWQRAEDRNRETAQILDQLGLSKYAAIEAFVRLNSLAGLS